MAVMECVGMIMPRSQAPMLQNANIEVGLDYGLDCFDTFVHSVTYRNACTLSIRYGTSLVPRPFFFN